MRRAEAGDDSRFLQGAVLRAPEFVPVRGRHGDPGAGARRAQRNGKQFLDGHGTPEFPVRALVRDAEAAFAQHAADGELAVMQGGAQRQGFLRHARRHAAAGRAMDVRGRQGAAAVGAGRGGHNAR